MKNIVIKGWMVAIAVFVLLFGGIYLTIGTGHWATTRTAEPIKLETGEYDPGDIRGSYAFAEVEKFFGIPIELLFQAFMIPEEKQTDTFKVKDMHEDLFAPVVINGTEIEVGTDLIRVFTSLYTDLPYESEETTHLPESAVNILLQEKKLDDEQKAYWEAHTFQLVLLGEAPAEEVQPAPSQEQPPAEQEQPAGETAEESGTIEIKGRTTIDELLDSGMTKEQFKEITGIDIPDDTSMKLKDFADANGLDMTTLRTQLTEALQQ